MHCWYLYCWSPLPVHCFGVFFSLPSQGQDHLTCSTWGLVQEEVMRGRIVQHVGPSVHRSPASKTRPKQRRVDGYAHIVANASSSKPVARNKVSPCVETPQPFHMDPASVPAPELSVGFHEAGIRVRLSRPSWTEREHKGVYAKHGLHGPLSRSNYMHSVGRFPHDRMVAEGMAKPKLEKVSRNPVWSLAYAVAGPPGCRRCSVKLPTPLLTHLRRAL
jgi:hypothetical protein